MFDSDSLHRLIDDLKERAKELNCIYEVREILLEKKAKPAENVKKSEIPLLQICRKVTFNLEN